jgi:uncharacterized phiE125 gp8 family phage protein
MEIIMRYPVRRVERIVSPAIEPITLAQAKTFLRIDGTSEDTLISDLIKTARIVAEQECGKSFITQSWRISYSDTAPSRVALPYGPVLNITSVTVIDEDGDEALIDSGNYHIDASGVTLMLELGLNGHRIEIEYQTGYGNAAIDVPADLVQAMLLHIAHLYEQRDSIMPPTFSMLIYAQQREIRL